VISNEFTEGHQVITCLKGGMGSTLINYHVFDKLGKDDDPVDLIMKSDVLAMFRHPTSML
jgi:hypothetical protein